MPERRRKTKEIRAEVAQIIAKEGGITAMRLMEAGYSQPNASSILRRMMQAGLLDESSVRIADDLGRKQARPYYTLKNTSGPLDEELAAVERKREKQRQYQRDYYRKQQQAKKGANGTPGRVGRPKGDRARLLESSSRLGQAASILFPNGIPVSEGFFAWVDLTRELMDNG